MPPFGSRRGNRVAAKAHLPISLNERLRDAIQTSPAHITLGEVCVEAIATTWTALADRGPKAPPGFTEFSGHRLIEGRLLPNEPTTPVVIYMSSDQALSIQHVREQLAGIEFGQLVRIALNAFLPPRMP